LLEDDGGALMAGAGNVTVQPVMQVVGEGDGLHGEEQRNDNYRQQRFQHPTQPHKLGP
jgi:hypothetical protein